MVGLKVLNWVGITATFLSVPWSPEGKAWPVTDQRGLLPIVPGFLQSSRSECEHPISLVPGPEYLEFSFNGQC